MLYLIAELKFSIAVLKEMSGLMCVRRVTVRLRRSLHFQSQSYNPTFLMSHRGTIESRSAGHISL